MGKNSKKQKNTKKQKQTQHQQRNISSGTTKKQQQQQQQQHQPQLDGVATAKTKTNQEQQQHTMGNQVVAENGAGAGGDGGTTENENTLTTTGAEGILQDLQELLLLKDEAASKSTTESDGMTSRVGGGGGGQVEEQHKQQLTQKQQQEQPDNDDDDDDDDENDPVEVVVVARSSSSSRRRSSSGSSQEEMTTMTSISTTTSTTVVITNEGSDINSSRGGGLREQADDATSFVTAVEDDDDAPLHDHHHHNDNGDKNNPTPLPSPTLDLSSIDTAGRVEDEELSPAAEDEEELSSTQPSHSIHSIRDYPSLPPPPRHHRHDPHHHPLVLLNNNNTKNNRHCEEKKDDLFATSPLQPNESKRFDDDVEDEEDSECHVEEQDEEVVHSGGDADEDEDDEDQQQQHLPLASSNNIPHAGSSSERHQDQHKYNSLSGGSSSSRTNDTSNNHDKQRNNIAASTKILRRALMQTGVEDDDSVEVDVTVEIVGGGTNSSLLCPHPGGPSQRRQLPLLPVAGTDLVSPAPPPRAVEYHHRIDHNSINNSVIDDDDDAVSIEKPQLTSQHLQLLTATVGKQLPLETTTLHSTSATSMMTEDDGDDDFESLPLPPPGPQLAPTGAEISDDDDKVTRIRESESSGADDAPVLPVVALVVEAGTTLTSSPTINPPENGETTTLMSDVNGSSAGDAAEFMDHPSHQTCCEAVVTGETTAGIDNKKPSSDIADAETSPPLSVAVLEMTQCETAAEGGTGRDSAAAPDEKPIPSSSGVVAAEESSELADASEKESVDDPDCKVASASEEDPMTDSRTLVQNESPKENPNINVPAVIGNITAAVVDKTSGERPNLVANALPAPTGESTEQKSVKAVVEEYGCGVGEETSASNVSDRDAIVNSTEPVVGGPLSTQVEVISAIVTSQAVSSEKKEGGTDSTNNVNAGTTVKVVETAECEMSNADNFVGLLPNEEPSPCSISQSAIAGCMASDAPDEKQVEVSGIDLSENDSEKPHMTSPNSSKVVSINASSGSRQQRNAPNPAKGGPETNKPDNSPQLPCSLADVRRLSIPILKGGPARNLTSSTSVSCEGLHRRSLSLSAAHDLPNSHAFDAGEATTPNDASPKPISINRQKSEPALLSDAESWIASIAAAAIRGEIQKTEKIASESPQVVKVKTIQGSPTIAERKKLLYMQRKSGKRDPSAVLELAERPLTVIESDDECDDDDHNQDIDHLTSPRVEKSPICSPTDSLNKGVVANLSPRESFRAPTSGTDSLTHITHRRHASTSSLPEETQRRNSVPNVSAAIDLVVASSPATSVLALVCGSPVVFRSPRRQPSEPKRIADLIRVDVWSGDPCVVEKALGVLASSAADEKNHGGIARTGGLLAIVRAMETHLEHPGIQVQACRCLEKLALDHDNELAIGEVGGIEAILSAMMSHTSDQLVQEVAWAALWNLTCGNADNQMVVDAAGGIDVLVQCMLQHSDHPDVQKNACGTLANLCLDNEERLTALSEAGGFVAISMALQKHWKNPDVRNEASYAMTILLGPRAESYDVPVAHGAKANQ